MSPPSQSRSARSAQAHVRLVASGQAFGDDVALADGLRRRDPVALATWYDRFALDVMRVLSRILGPDPQLPDVHHDVFVRALGSLGTLEDPSALRSWLIAVTVHTARTVLARRARGRWLRFLSWRDLPEVQVTPATAESVEAVRQVYEVLDELTADDRLVFALRYIEGMELLEVADSCGVSLATVKRRIARAQGRFLIRARRYPALREWLDKEVPDGDG